MERKQFEPSGRDLADATAIMIGFAERTGLAAVGCEPRRYLWTDAFAVCEFLSLFEVTGEERFLKLAMRLVDQVHETLGRHRPEGSRRGWISELDEEEGHRHPTAGGLRIGKKLDERGAGDAFDERMEWDRDGQYFNYLTKWMHALARTAVVTSEAKYCRWALELALAAHAAFTYTPQSGGAPRMYWKMSIDLSRPLLASMGHHDPLDAFVNYCELAHCHKTCFSASEMPGLDTQIEDAARMCAAKNWASDDPLGLGGLLVDACRVALLPPGLSMLQGPVLESLLADAQSGLSVFTNRYPLHAQADDRLAFREFGLSIGLHAVEDLRHRIETGEVSISDVGADELSRLLPLVPMAGQIESFWRNPSNQAASTWLDHLDINSVMLATSLLPLQFLRT